MTSEDYNKAYLSLMRNPNMDFKRSGLPTSDKQEWEKLKADIKKAIEENRIVEMPSDFEDLSGFDYRKHYES